MSSDRARSVYLHFPFCEVRCHYCDFYSIANERAGGDDRDHFLKSLLKEIELRSPEIENTLETIFFGGGTPSMTSPEAHEKIVSALMKERSLAPNYEWTSEVNPSSASTEVLKTLRELGVNRISMGVQAIKPELLKWLGRVHDTQGVHTALERVFEAGFENVSVDLMCGIPGQSLTEISEAVETLCSYPITHLSCYLLTLGSKHRLAAQLPTEETQLEHLLHLSKLMNEFGFRQYEISNFCKPGKEAQHNLSYWKRKSYVGLGPSAHGFTEPDQRFKNFSSLKKYSESLLNKNELPIEWRETLSESERETEKWMLALRLDEGFPVGWLSTEQLSRVMKLREHGLVENHPSSENTLRLTAHGFALSDQIVSEIISI